MHLSIHAPAAGPFSHRTMLTLEEKGVPYNKLLLDESNIPDWCATLQAVCTWTPVISKQ